MAGGRTQCCEARSDTQATAVTPRQQEPRAASGVQAQTPQLLCGTEEKSAEQQRARETHQEAEPDCSTSVMAAFGPSPTQIINAMCDRMVRQAKTLPTGWGALNSVGALTWPMHRVIRCQTNPFLIPM